MRRAAMTSGTLNSRLLPQFFQFVKTRSALPDVGEQVGERSVRRPVREFQQDFAAWTGCVLGIGKVFMHDPVERIEQFFFRIHSPHLGWRWKPSAMAMSSSRIPRSLIAVDENLRVHPTSGGPEILCAMSQTLSS
jgi:hypothetical protein